jgi:hypothetical protein
VLPRVVEDIYFQGGTKRPWKDGQIRYQCVDITARSASTTALGPGVEQGEADMDPEPGVEGRPRALLRPSGQVPAPASPARAR